ncbi:MAG: signal peptidase I [bacterium]
MTCGSEPARANVPMESLLFVRFFVTIWLVLLISRTFLLEPNQIPTGSMAPGRLGRHLSLKCDECHYQWALGILPDNRRGDAACPNCGNARPEKLKTNQAVYDGDRLWVLKPGFIFSAPERFDEVVFYSPDAPLTPHLKRIVGLPGEKIQIKDGDLFINDKLVKKNEKSRRALGILVFDQHFPANSASLLPRWHFTSSAGGDWKTEADGSIAFQRDESREMNSATVEYRHFSPDRQEFAPVNDFLAYNGRNQGIDHEVDDLRYCAMIQTENMQDLSLRLTNRNMNIEIRWANTIPDHPFEFIINNKAIKPLEIKQDRRIKPTGEFKIELSVVDHQLEFMINNSDVFFRFPLDKIPARMPDESLRNTPAGFSFTGDRFKITDFKLYRDIYYTDRTADEPVKGIATDEPVNIPPDHYFVLGDNSQMSVDSRFWQRGSFVHRMAIIGRPLRRTNQE